MRVAKSAWDRTWRVLLCAALVIVLTLAAALVAAVCLAKDNTESLESAPVAQNVAPEIPTAWAEDRSAWIPLKLLTDVNVDGMARLSDAGFSLSTCAGDGAALGRLLKIFLAKKLHPDDLVALVRAYISGESSANDTLSQVVSVPIAEDEHACIVGDIHGEYRAVPALLQRCGVVPGASSVPLRRTIFNGDLVDRGSNSVGVVAALLAARLAFPAHVHVGRGNHEDPIICRTYGFMREVAETYGRSHAPRVFLAVLAAFAYMPALHVAGNTLVVHGGLPVRQYAVRPEVLADTAAPHFARPTPTLSVDRASPLAEYLWNDPSDADPHVGRLDADCACRRRFGPSTTAAFLAANGFARIVRSHEAVVGGFRTHHGGSVVTIFSSPGYGGDRRAVGAYLLLDPQGEYTVHTLTLADISRDF